MVFQQQWGQGDGHVYSPCEKLDSNFCNLDHLGSLVQHQTSGPPIPFSCNLFAYSGRKYNQVRKAC